MDAQPKIVVGIDFGTTYSALAWASTSSPTHITLIGAWPSAGSRTHHSAPSEISYPPGSTSSYTWGYDIAPNARRLKWFKLLLETADDADSSSTPLPPGMTPTDVTRDFLNALYRHTIETLWRQNGDAVMAGTKVDFVLTVPAVWSEAAKSRTRRAAEEAGMGGEHGLLLLSEPEAAAIYSIKIQDQVAINLNDRIVVCDAGGGTVDLISYTVQSVSPSLSVTECAVGTGDFCGSTYIDRAFSTYLQKRMGTHFTSLRAETQQRIIKNFEEVKCAFEDRPEKPSFYVSIPTLDTIEDAGIVDGELEISRADMRALFDPVVAQVLALLDGQVAAVGARVASVLLVGGFGESKYLYKRLQAWGAGKGIACLQPRDAATAVVKGAVLRGLQPLLPSGHTGGISVTRLARRHYGAPMSTPFIPGRHLESDAYPDPVTGQKMARNQVSWFIRKGDALPEQHTATRHFTRSFRKYSGPWFDALVYCESDTAPSRITPEVKHLCTIETDLSGVKKSEYEKRWKRWSKFYTARYSLDVSVRSGGMMFQLCFKGASYGGVAKVDFEGGGGGAGVAMELQA
ncbi:hypothetical protein EDC01DRAFT_781954 [Geopyxis carbonaria]|nr:hypothetical protein EDC01DRAFT_781954 [Geopyxis carbonaria]